MRKIAVLILSAVLFLVFAQVSSVFAHSKPSPKKSVQKSKKKPAPKRPAPISSEEQLKALLIKKLSRTFPKGELEALFSDSRLFLDRSIFQAGAPSCPGGYLNPDCGILIPESLRRGKDFLDKYEEVVNAVFEKCGVDAEVIAAILRVETNFGSYLGKRSALNTLYTLYVLSPRRRNFALEQIEFLLRLAKKNGWEDPFEIKGSTAGAIGIPQFIPFSYWHFAIDGNGDGKTDLFDPVDAIHSVANYLSEHGWSEKSKDQRNAVWAYNHDRVYVNAVLAYAQALKNIRSN